MFLLGAIIWMSPPVTALCVSLADVSLHWLYLTMLENVYNE